MSKELKVPRLVGSKVKEIRKITNEECNDLGVDQEHGLLVVLDTGVKLVALRDPEGNGLGTLVGVYEQSSFYIAEETA